MLSVFILSEVDELSVAPTNSNALFPLEWNTLCTAPDTPTTTYGGGSPFATHLYSVLSARKTPVFRKKLLLLSSEFKKVSSCTMFIPGFVKIGYLQTLYCSLHALSINNS
jgi:hypothetical protein